jgi:hypothetical protein
VVSGGELANSVAVVECWDDNIDRTYVGVNDNGNMVVEEGGCSSPFDQELQALGVPSLEDVDTAILQKMECVAVNGVRACDD